MNTHQRPKIEEYGDSLFIVLHTVQLIGNKLEFGTHLGKNTAQVIQYFFGEYVTPIFSYEDQMNDAP